MVSPCHTNYYTRAIVRMGEAHRARSLPGQDHAVALGLDEGIILAAADGVSLIGEEHSRAEAGAWLIAELAAAGAAKALKRGEGEPGAIKVAAATAIAAGLYPLWHTIGNRRAQVGLTSTLLLMVVTPRWTHAWASGDGYWGLVLPADSRERVTGEQLAAEVGDYTWIGGQRHAAKLKRLASTAPASRIDELEAREAVIEQLRSVLSCGAPVLGAYVATDGLRHEPALAALLKQPARSPDALQTSIQRLPGCDDLGVALAAERVEGWVTCDVY